MANKVNYLDTESDLILCTLTSEKDKIYRGFTEFPIAPLQGVPTYDYMTDLNVYLKACSSSVNCALGAGRWGILF